MAQSETVPFALYDAFTDRAFGGSQACILSDASRIPGRLRPRIAMEIGHPATCFVDRIDERGVTAQFFSTLQELPMCGHGTMCLMAECLDRGWFRGAAEVTLRLPGGPAQIVLEPGGARPMPMLAVAPPGFRAVSVGRDRVAGVLGLDPAMLGDGAPVEIATGDFSHLVVPVAGLAAMAAIRPDFGAIIDLCHEIDAHTLTAFCLDTVSPAAQVHVRDFCPAVGVAESAAAGTTNAALTVYLLRHRLVAPDASGRAEVRAEQGIEIDRPSAIRTVARLEAGAIATLHVGGTATRIAEGVLHLPPDELR